MARSVSVLLVSLMSIACSSWGLFISARTEYYGADSCDQDCTEDTIVVYECAHFGLNDPCGANQCIVDRIFRAHCSGITEGADCTFTPPFPGTWVTQELRTTNNCATNNPNNWNAFAPGACEWFQNYSTRCETGGCAGPIVANSSRQTDLLYCSH